VCVQNKLLEKKKKKKKNQTTKDNTHTDIFFANDYKATKTRAFENTLIWNMHGIIHTIRKKRKENETKTEKFENWSNIKTHTS